MRGRARAWASTFSAGASWSPALLSYTDVLGSELASWLVSCYSGVISPCWGVTSGGRSPTNNILDRREGPLCRFRNGSRVRAYAWICEFSIRNPAGRPTMMRPTIPAISCGRQK